MKNFKNNFVVKFVISLFLISIIIGILFSIAYKPDLTSYIEEFKTLINTTHQNVYLLNIGITSLILVLSISIIGLPAIVFYIFYEGFSIGFTLGAFFAISGFKGILFYLLFFIITKLIFTILILYFIIMSIRFIYRLLESLFQKNKENLYKSITNHFYRYLLIIVILLITDTFIYFLGNTIIRIFINLI